MSLDRGEVWKKLGEPNDQQGSVNDPRTTAEHGATWNEKWIYLGEDGETIDRVVLWNRYDLVGVFRLKPDGSAEAESIGEG
jgi:hypothetical protein